MQGAQFGSVTNSGAATLAAGSPLAFRGGEALHGIGVDDAHTTLTLYGEGFWRITVGVSVASFDGAPTLNMASNGASAPAALPITAPGSASFDWIESFPENTQLSFTVQGGNITLPDARNAYLTVMRYGA
jgi:hypothetical protein